jgi:hypothetical protein
MAETLRQVIHDHMAQIAALHAAGLYRHLDGDTAAQLFALLTDTALAYLMEVEADLAGPGPGQSLAAASDLSAKGTLLAGLAENLDLKNRDPGMAPVNGWLAWRAANEKESGPATQPGRQQAEVPPPVIARAEELGRDAGQAAASRVFDGNTSEEAYRRVLRGIKDGDPAVLDAIEPPAIGPAAGYGQDDLARDLGIAPGDPALPRAVSAYADAFTGSFWQDTERAAREHAG